MGWVGGWVGTVERTERERVARNSTGGRSPDVARVGETEVAVTSVQFDCSKANQARLQQFFR